MADLAVRLLQLRGEFAKEFSLSEGHSLVQQAARVGLQIEVNDGTNLRSGD